MKINIKIIYIFLIIAVILSVFFIYRVFGKNNTNEDSKNKALADVNEIERKFVDLFNQLNNITFDNYKISISEIKESQAENNKSSSGKSSSNEKNSQGSSESENSEQEKETSKDNKEYKLEETGILTMNSEIDWKEIKKDVEEIYTSLYPATLDLYQTNINQQDIVSFNKEYDKLTKAVKEEDKEQSLTELSVLYDYLPRFVSNCTDEERNKTIINTKNYIFKAYSILDTEDWNNISRNINNATEEFTKLVTNINNKEIGNQYNINKVYIMINELQNAIDLKDKEIFLIKYKKLLEEIQNI